MERGYLVALLSIVAVFTGTSHGFRSLEQWSARHLRQFGVVAQQKCHSNTSARALAEMSALPHAHFAEEAQLLAELNLPTRAQAATVEEMARQAVDSARCTRVRAMQEADRARRDMQRARRDMVQVRVDPLSLQVNLPPDFEEQIQQSTTVAARLAEQQIKVRILEHQFDGPARQSRSAQ